MGLKAYPFGTHMFPDKFDVVDSVTLQCTDLIENNNKFYQIELHEAGSEYRIYSCYGRTGAPGKKEERIPHGAWEAKDEFSRLRKEKMRKYTQVMVATTSKGTETGNSKILSTDVKLTVVPAVHSSIPMQIGNLVARLYEEAGSTVSGQLSGSLKSSVENPLGTLTLGQIDSGKEILKQVNALLHGNKSLIDTTAPEIITLTNQFYSAIPHKIELPSRNNRDAWLKQYALNNSQILDEKYDLLDLLGNVQGMVKGFGSDLDTKYREIGCEFEYLDKSSPYYKSIENHILSTQSDKHYWKIRVQNVWAVKVKAQEEPSYKNKMDYVKNVQPLFHGSRPCNILGICKKGLLLRPPGAYVTGSMFGNGLYFADQSTKSSQYSTARFGGTGTNKNTYFMFVTDVALGRIKEFSNAQPSLNSAPAGYDSVQGVKGSSLVHNEFIIYDIHQQKLQYLVEFSQ
jgi:poly [ADP-ribose] polymerase